MQYHEFIPDIIDREPENILKVVYPNDETIFFGNLMTVSQVEEQPNVIWDAEQSDFYTLCMIDPDAPDRDEPKFRSWLHWLVTNIPGNDISKGNVLAEYVGCKPPTSLNLHRYTFLLYKQNGQISFDEKRLDKRSEEHRPNFLVKQFVKKYQLGPLFAANFFSGAYDHQAFTAGVYWMKSIFWAILPWSVLNHRSEEH